MDSWIAARTILEYALVAFINVACIVSSFAFVSLSTLKIYHLGQIVHARGDRLSDAHTIERWPFAGIVGAGYAVVSFFTYCFAYPMELVSMDYKHWLLTTVIVVGVVEAVAIVGIGIGFLVYMSLGGWRRDSTLPHVRQGVDDGVDMDGVVVG